MREREAEKAARAEAVALVERYNAAIAAGHGDIWSPTVRAAKLVRSGFAVALVGVVASNPAAFAL
jgi:hypothetical protein